MRLDTFKLITYQNIDLDERNVITLLYQPIIGCKPYSLYLTLWSLIDRSRLKSPEYVHRKLYDLLSLTPAKFIEARKVLEAIGLLVVYQSEEMYLYELKAPVSAEEFIKDGSLGAYLFKKIGKTEFDSISSLFRISIPEKQGFKNITANFDDVFSSIHETVTTNDEYISRSKPKININHDFDFDVFLEGLSKNFVDRRKLTPRIREKINHLSYVYDMDEITMQKAFMDSVDEERNIDLDLLMKRAKYWGNVVRKTMDSAVKSEEEVDVTFDVVKALCNKYPLKDILGVFTGSEPSDKEKETLYRVESEFDLPKEVLNFLVLYAYGNSKIKQLPNYRYLNTIYTTWRRSNVKTIDDAFNLTVEFKDDMKKSTEPKKKSKKFEPDWLEDVMKEF